MATSSEKQEFYRVYGPIVEAQCRGTGLYPEVILAQLALESDYGTKPAAHGNLGGRKISENQKANGVEGETYEIRKTHEKFSTQQEAIDYAAKQRKLGYKVYGQPKKQGDEFVVYVNQPFEISGTGTPEDNVRGQIEFLERNNRYRKNGVFTANSAEEQAKALKKAGYATDGKYANKLVSVYSQADFPKFEVSQQEYEAYYEGAESVVVDGDNVIATYPGGEVITDKKTVVDRFIKEEQDVKAKGGVVGVDEKKIETTGQDNQPTSPPVTGPGIEGDTQTIPQIDRTQESGGGLSNEVADPKDTEDYQYEVTQEEAERVFGPTARLQNVNGKDVIVYTDDEGNSKQVDVNTVTEETPNYRPPVEPYKPPVFEDQQSRQDRTQAPPIIEADPAPQKVDKIPIRKIETKKDPVELEEAISPEVLKDREEIAEARRFAESDPRTLEEIEAEMREREEEEERQERIKRAEAEGGDDEEIEIEEEEETTDNIPKTGEFYPGTNIPQTEDPQRLIDEGFVFDKEQGIYVKQDTQGEDSEETQKEPDRSMYIEKPEGLGTSSIFYKDGNTFQVDDEGNIKMAMKGGSPEVPENAQPGDLFQDDGGYTYKVLPNGEIAFITKAELKSIDNPVIINAPGNENAETAGDGEADPKVNDVVEGITAPEGSESGDVFTVDGKDYAVQDDGSVTFIGYPQEVVEGADETQTSSSLTLEEVQEIYGPDASITEVNGQEQIIVPGSLEDRSEDQYIMMSDAVLKRDNEIALQEELQQEKNANLLGLKRKDFKDLKEEDLTARLDETTLSDEEKAKIKRRWTNANKASILDRLYEDFVAGDDSALKKAGNLLKSAGGVSSLVAGFIGAKAAKKGMEEVPVPRLEGLSTAFKQYSQQQKALAESGLSYAERRTLEQGIDQSYEAGIQNLVRGTGGDRAKFLAGTGALDFNRQTSLLKVAALEDEARRQNRAAYGDLLKFEATQNREKDIFTKSREYNQKLADKAMFQNTASAAFQHVFDNIRFGQDYKPLMDQMTQAVNRMGGIMGLTDQISEQVQKNTERFNQIEAPDLNEENQGNEENEENDG